MKNAMAAKLATGKVANMGKADLLGVTIQEYNKQVPIRSWKLSGEARKVIECLMKCSDSFVGLLHKHHSRYRHETSGGWEL